MKLNFKSIHSKNNRKNGKELLEKAFLMNSNYFRNIIKKNCFHLLKIYLKEKVFLKNFRDKFFICYRRNFKILLRFRNFLKIKKKFIKISVKRFEKYFKIMNQLDKEIIPEKKLDLEKNSVIFYEIKEKFSEFLFEFYNFKHLKSKIKTFKNFDCEKIKKSILLKYRDIFQIYIFSQMKSNYFNSYFINFTNFHQNNEKNKISLYKYDSQISILDLDNKSFEIKEDFNKINIVENTYVRFIYEIFHNINMIGKKFAKDD